MAILIGSARHDENGNYTGGKAGDQLQTSVGDLTGECSMQTFYVHSKGWYVLRPVTKSLAKDIAFAMATLCNNKSAGYSQSCQRTSVDDITSIVPFNIDCSKGVRDCIYYASKKDVGNFTTANEVSVLEKSGLFETHFAYVNQTKTPIYDGDVLVTKTKGHTVIIVTGSERPDDELYYPKYTGSSSSIITALKAVGVTDTSLSYRTKIAKKNNISNYSGKASENLKMVNLLKAGKLLKV